MKKLIALVLALTCILALVACGQQGQSIEEENGLERAESITTSQKDFEPGQTLQPDPSWAILQNDDADVMISLDDMALIIEIVEAGNWIESVTKCASDYTITSDSRTTLYYHSDCGTVNDKANNRSFGLTEEQRLQINTILNNGK